MQFTRRGSKSDEGMFEAISVSCHALADRALWIHCYVLYSVHLGSEPAIVKVQGLDCMNDDHSAVSVLFAKIQLTDSSDR